YPPIRIIESEEADAENTHISEEQPQNCTRHLSGVQLGPSQTPSPDLSPGGSEAFSANPEPYDPVLDAVASSEYHSFPAFEAMNAWLGSSNGPETTDKYQNNTESTAISVENNIPRLEAGNTSLNLSGANIAEESVQAKDFFSDVNSMAFTQEGGMNFQDLMDMNLDDISTWELPPDTWS
ncbi:MAG: hypothetical protein Q9191_008408, partial [Dirinaria sp. TL-2023a]